MLLAPVFSPDGTSGISESTASVAMYTAQSAIEIARSKDFQWQKGKSNSSTLRAVDRLAEEPEPPLLPLLEFESPAETPLSLRSSAQQRRKAAWMEMEYRGVYVP